MKVPPSSEEREAEIAEAVEALEEQLENAVMAVEAGERTPLSELVDLTESDILATDPQIAIQVLLTTLGVDLNSPPLNTEFTQGTPQNPGQGSIQITTYPTNQEGVFVKRWEYADGDIDWAISPYEHPED
jgi:hypothetical protein